MKNVTTSKLLGRSVIIRKRRALKRPFSYSEGLCFHKLTGGLYSLYIEKGSPEREVGFGKIIDRY